MPYVVTYGPPDDQRLVECETAAEAIELVIAHGLRGGQHVTVVCVEDGVSIEVLRWPAGSRADEGE